MPLRIMLMKPEVKGKQEAEVETEALTRTVGVSYAALFYFASGIYYLAVPIAMQDYTLFHLFATGILSIIAGVLLLRMSKWGLWLGLLLFPVQLVLASAGFASEFMLAGALQSAVSVAFLASLGVLIFFGCVTFLVLLDQRKNFIPVTPAPKK